MYFNMHFLLYGCNTWFSMLHFCLELGKLQGFHCYRFWRVVLWMWVKCIVSTHTLWHKASWMLKALLTTSFLWTSNSSSLP